MYKLLHEFSLFAILAPDELSYAIFAKTADSESDNKKNLLLLRARTLSVRNRTKRDFSVSDDR